jgi:hypothetical protein
MDFEAVSLLGNYISKDYAWDMFGLLVRYRDISASEAASRLGIHIRTAQDFLEAMESLGIISKEEVYEKKRPYFRYKLTVPRISIDLDLEELVPLEPDGDTEKTIREIKNSGAIFTTARSGDRISSITVWAGEGRERKGRKINLTSAQGTFLFHLPFPNASPMTIDAIMTKAGIEESFGPEILDLVDILEDYGVIESQAGSGNVNE